MDVVRLFLPLAVTLASAASAQEQPVLIRGAAIFDGERAIGARDVLLEKGRITRVARRISTETAWTMPPPAAN